MAYRYRVLALDHDDTTVRSTPEINWPAFVDTLEHLRPDVKYTYEEFFGLCFKPGFDDLCRKILKLDEDEMKFEVENWRRFQDRTVPTACDGIGDVIDGARSRGIILAVVSHSVRAGIERDWLANFGILPDLIYDWDDDPSKRKPSPYPLFDIARRAGCRVSDILVVDDLKHGFDMAAAAGADFAYAGWSGGTPAIAEFMKKNAKYCFGSPADLGEVIFDGGK